MHLVIINASPRVKAKSNTARIIRTFVRGFEVSGNTTEVWHLSDKKQWVGAKEAYEKNSNILFALPLYVESVPGIMLEFLETLQPKKETGTKMSFILQGGFAEASQLRCGEAYLEILPSYLNCEYNGTLIKGDNFGASWVPEAMAEKMVAHYEKMGRSFAEKKTFYKEEVNEFAAPEYFSEKEIRQHKRTGRWIQKALFCYIAKKNGCKKPLDDKPYQVK
ncbi:MAG: NAD(P)H-dependent oxidoreductase [Lachnospiraceae bacterium]|nr:NAD(P)H-dependent oxidoreductase [Lachnospiraceae bacterium]